MSTTIECPPEAPESLGENLAEALDQGLGGAVEALPPWVMATTPAYPIQVAFEPPPRSKRFWAIPLLGLVAKVIVLIPHFIALAFFGTLSVLAQLVGGNIRWSARVYSYLLGLTDAYPPFHMG